MKSKPFMAGLALALSAAYTGGALAQAKPETQVKQRQSVMTLQGKYFFPLAAMAGGKAPYNADVAARNAHFLDTLDKMPWDNFVPGTSQADLKDTRALPAIFKDQAGFKAAQEQLMTAVSKLAENAKNEAAFKTAAGDVGKACNGCHDKFRAKQ